ncbi:MAG: GntR family transcriptional regulator [Gammaproteobacteria bacterium]|nr:GntR family transcriptional regulator [Gammaproteobacteria bacterium]
MKMPKTGMAVPHHGAGQSSNLMDVAYTRLERMIVNGNLQPGQWVSETYLMEASGLSRAPVRVAIQRLADQQLIQVFPRRGAQICPIDYTLQFRALELRRVVERLMASSAAERASTCQRRELADISAGFRQATIIQDQATMTDLDSRAFSLILAAANNPYASGAMKSVKGLARRFWVLHQEEFGDRVRMAICHAGITDAVSKGDAVQASANVDDLIDYIEEFTLKVIGFGSHLGRNRQAQA